MPVIRFTNVHIPQIQADIDKVLAAVGNKYGIDISAKFRKGSGQTLEFNMQANVKDATGQVLSQGRSDWSMYATRNGFKAEDFGKVILFQGQWYRISGYNSNAPRFPIEATRLRGNKPFRLTAETVRRALPTARAA